MKPAGERNEQRMTGGEPPTTSTTVLATSDSTRLGTTASGRESTCRWLLDSTGGWPEFELVNDL